MSEPTMPKPRSVGVSIEWSPDMAMLGVGAEHLLDVLAELARHLLASGVSLVFAGDLRPGAATELLFELVARHWPDDPATEGRPPFVQYAVWPAPPTWHGTPWEIIRSDWAGLVEWHFIDPDRRDRTIDEALSTATSDASSGDAHAALTALRKQLARVTDARVFIGGAKDSQHNKMPSVAEECMHACQSQQPLFLLGGFGGCTRDIAWKWGLLSDDAAGGFPWWGLFVFHSGYMTSLRNGLSEQENRQLARTLHTDEALALILKGMTQLRKHWTAMDPIDRQIDAAMDLVRRGERAAARDALDKVMADPAATADQIAKALRSRSRLVEEDDGYAGELASLYTVIAMPGLSAHELCSALLRRAGIYYLKDENDAALVDYTTVIERPDAPDDLRKEALIERFNLRKYTDEAGALADLSAVLALSGPEPALLMLRTRFRLECGDWPGVIADCSDIIRVGERSSSDVASALYYRAMMRKRLGDESGAIDDYSELLECPGASDFECAQARQSLCDLRGDTSQPDDHYRVIESDFAGHERKSWALLGRATEREEHGLHQAAIKYLTEVVQLSDAPIGDLIQALQRRSALTTDVAGRIADYTAVLELEGATEEQRAKAWLARATTRLRLGDVEGALSDCAAVKGLPAASQELLDQAEVIRLTVVIGRLDTPADERAKVLIRRAAVKLTLGDRPGAFADFARVVVMDGVSVEQRAVALNNRGYARYGIAEEFSEASSDFMAVASLEGCPSAYVAAAMFNLACLETALDQQIAGHKTGQASELFAKVLDIRSAVDEYDYRVQMYAAIRDAVEHLTGSGLMHRLSAPIEDQASADAGNRSGEGGLRDSARKNRAESAELLQSMLQHGEALQSPVVPPPNRFRQ